MSYFLHQPQPDNVSRFRDGFPVCCGHNFTGPARHLDKSEWNFILGVRFKGLGMLDCGMLGKPKCDVNGFM